jgi:hypothetical protein
MSEFCQITDLLGAYFSLGVWRGLPFNLSFSITSYVYIKINFE